MSSEWFYTCYGKDKAGPVSSTVLHSLAESGKLKPTDLVWKEGMAHWVSASKIKGLFGSTEPSRTKKPVPTTATDPSIFDHPASSGWSNKTILVAGAGLLFTFLLCCGGISNKVERDRVEARKKAEQERAEVGKKVVQEQLEARMKAEQARRKAQKKLSQGNDLWAVGKKEDAVGKYKSIIQDDMIAMESGELPTIYQRVIEFDAGEGNTSSARTFIDDALGRNVALSFAPGTKANDLHSQVVAERREREAMVFAEKKRQEENRQAIALAKQKKADVVAMKQPRGKQSMAGKQNVGKEEQAQKQAEFLAKAKKDFEDNLRKDRLDDEQLKLMALAVVADLKPGLNPGTATGWGITTPEKFNELMQSAARTLRADQNPETKHLLSIQPSRRKVGTFEGKPMVTVYYGTQVYAGFIQNSINGNLVLLMVKVDTEKYTPFGVR